MKHKQCSSGRPVWAALLLLAASATAPAQDSSAAPALEDERLRQHWFASMHEAREIVEAWRRDYNHVRPHSTLKYRTPKEVARQHQVTKNEPETPHGACLS
jgi:transposase InsO family protein